MISPFVTAQKIFAQAWPVLLGQWATMAYSVIDTIMTGHSSTADLAAIGLGSAIYLTTFVGLMGILQSLNPVLAQLFGAKQYHIIGSRTFQGFWLALMLALLGGLMLGFPNTWLIFSGEISNEVRVKLSNYLQALMFALPAALIFRVIYALNISISRPKAVMVINLIGLALKALLSWILIFGHFGLPALGTLGCGISTAIVSWISMSLGLLLLQQDSVYKRFHFNLNWQQTVKPQWKALAELLRLGLPIGLSYIIEVTSFTFMALLAARLGTQTTAGHQIAANLISVFFMIPLAFAIATSTLTAQAIGAQNLPLAHRTVKCGLAIAFFIAVCVASILLLNQRYIVDIYTKDIQTKEIVFNLVIYLALFHLFDAIQVVISFVLRAFKITVIPLLIYGVSLWGLGLAGGYSLGFTDLFGKPLGIQGLWLGATYSLGLAAILLLSWYYWRVYKRKV